MAYTNFLKPTSVTQTTASSEISWNLDTSPYNISTGCSTTEPLTKEVVDLPFRLVFGCKGCCSDLLGL